MIDINECDRLTHIVCSSLIKSRPSLKDDFLQIGRIAVHEALQKIDAQSDGAESLIKKYIEWRCTSFYNQNKVQGIATPAKNLKDRTPKVYSLDASQYERASATDYEVRDTEQIQNFIDYLDNKNVREYAVLFFAGADAVEIQTKLGLTGRERDKRQQQFKYWIDKYFNLPSSKNKWSGKSDRQRLKKAAPKGSKKAKPEKILRVSPWKLQQAQIEEDKKILRISLNKSKPQRRSPLFETDLSDWGREKVKMTRNLYTGK